MKNIIENMQTAVLFREIGRTERKSEEAKEKQEKFAEKLKLQEDSKAAAAKSKLEGQIIASNLKSTDAASKRNELMVMMLSGI